MHQSLARRWLRRMPRRRYLNEADHDVTSTVALARNDTEVTAKLVETFGAAMPQGQATLATFIEAAGHGARDMAAILNSMRKESR